MKLENKIAIVTGAGQGIGREIAVGLASQGAKVIIADIVEAKSQETLEEIKGMGKQAIAIKTDITSIESINNLVKSAKEAFDGKIDILVNVAGVCKQEDIFDTSEQVWDLTMNINMKGLFFCSQKVGEVMSKNGGGKIINIASTSSFITSSKCMVAYDASKSGVKMLTTLLAEWLGPYNINVNAIAPATTKTKLITEIFGEHYWEGDWVRTKYPLGRIAYPSDHLKAILFLCSEDASYINGHTMLVDGGCLLAYRRTEN